MPSLRKRVLKSGTVVWDIKYRVDGKQKYYTIGETDRRTAEKIFHKFCNKLAESKDDVTGSEPKLEEPSLTLRELAEHAKIYAAANKSHQTMVREQEALEALLRFFGNVSLSELTPARMEEFKAAKLATVSPATINISIRVLNTTISQAIDLGRLRAVQTKPFKQIRLQEAEPPLWLNDDEVALLLSTSDSEFRLFLLFLLHTGCRRNEALGLTWEDVDLQRRQVIVRGSVGKMGKRRTIPINESLFEALNNWHGKRNGRLFPNYKSNQISMKFRHWAKRIELREGISLHSLRATFASVLIEKGVDIYTVSRLLGHSSVKVTEKHYIALDAKHVRTAVEALIFN